MFWINSTRSDRVVWALAALESQTDDSKTTIKEEKNTENEHPNEKNVFGICWFSIESAVAVIIPLSFQLVYLFDTNFGGWLAEWFVCSSFRFRRAFWLGASTLSFCHRSTILCLFFSSFFYHNSTFDFLLSVDFRRFYLLYMCRVFFSFVRLIYFTHNIWMRDIIRWFHKKYLFYCMPRGLRIRSRYVCMFWGSQSHCQLYCGIICIIWNKREKNQKNRYKKKSKLKKKTQKTPYTRRLVNKLVVNGKKRTYIISFNIVYVIWDCWMLINFLCVRARVFLARTYLLSSSISNILKTCHVKWSKQTPTI